jgi:predicted transcriptional regulator
MPSTKLCAGLKLMVVLGTLACAALAQTSQTMPSIEGESFTGGKVILPDAARSKVAVLIFGFTKASKEPTSAWADKIQSDLGSRAGFEMYQLPVLEDVPRFVRGMVISSMKKGVRENMRDHFVPILQHELELKKLVSYQEKDDAYLVILDATGRVIHQTHGPFSEEAYQQFRSEVQALLNQQK